jgi:PleD family two-component response regulator
MTRTRGPTGQDPSPRPRRGTLTSRLEPDETILVVEDEPDIANFLRAYFRAGGQEVVHVDPTSPEQVASAVAEHHPSCVLLDLNLRGFHGLEAYREIRKSDADALLPVVIVTADHSKATRDEALARGVDAFVTKPFNIKDLCRIVQERVEGAAHSAAAARPDEATGLGGAAYLQDRLADEVASGKEEDKPVTLALVRMRPMPDAGVLREVVSRLQASLPDDAVLARSAEDELAVILPGTEAESAAAGLERSLAAGADGLDLALHAGVAACPAHAGTGDELYMAADAALAEGSDRGALVTVAV